MNAACRRESVQAMSRASGREAPATPAARPGRLPERPAAGLRRSPRPPGDPRDPVAQWLLDAILSGLTLQQICDRGRQDEIDFPTAKGGGARHALALGHVLGKAKGTPATMMRTPAARRDA